MILESINDDHIYVGNFKCFPERKYPFFHSFSQDGSLVLISESASITHKFAQHFTTALAYLYSSNLYLHVFDPLFFGGHLDKLAKLHPDLKAHRVQTEQDGLSDIIKELRYRISAVNQDVLSGETSNQSLAKYLRTNPDSNEKIHLFYINGFPYRWDSKSISLLLDILRLGPKAGVYTIIMADPTIKIEQDGKFNIYDVLKICRSMFYHTGMIEIIPSPLRHISNIRFFCDLYFQNLNNKKLDVIEKISHDIEKNKNKSVKITSEIVKNFAHAQTSIEGISIPVGKKGNGSIHYFEIGDSNGCYHALVGGGTGSGKTVLLHNIILHGSYLYSEDQLQFCLLDYKEGTEFQIYKNIPNVKILSIESELEFGVSFLKYINKLISDRGGLFKQLGVSNLKAARNNSMQEIPRIFIVIDEFQVLLNDSFRGSSLVSELIDDIAKRGRSFGIHLILSSQSLAGVGLKSSTLSQIPLRVVLKISQQDSERLLTEGNTEPAFFKKRGQAIYNSNSGTLEANEYFTVSLVDDENFNDIVPMIKSRGIINSVSSIPHRVFDPSKSAILSNLLTKKHDSSDIVVGEPFFMAEKEIHYISTGISTDCSTCFTSRSIDELNLFSSILAGQLQNKESSVYLVCDKNSFNYIINLVQKNFSLKNILNIDNEDDLIDVIQNKGNFELIIPDCTNFRLFKAEGYSKSKSADAIVSAINEATNNKINIHLGAQSRVKLRDRFDFSKIQSEISHFFILSNGTNMESECSIHNLRTLKNDMAIHVCNDFEEGYVVFKKATI